ncbi:unnamed protein product [Diamesa hyperborea]
MDIQKVDYMKLFGLQHIKEQKHKLLKPYYVMPFGPCETPPSEYVAFKKETFKYKPKSIKPVVTRSGCKPKRFFIKPFEWELAEERKALLKIKRGKAAKAPRTRKIAKVTKKYAAQEKIAAPESPVEETSTDGEDCEVKVAINTPSTLAAADNEQMVEFGPDEKVFHELKEHLSYFSKKPTLFAHHPYTKMVAVKGDHTIIAHEPIRVPFYLYLQNLRKKPEQAMDLIKNKKPVKRLAAKKKVVPVLDAMSLVFQRMSSHVRIH